MLFIEIPQDFNYNLNIIKYRNINEDSWYYLYIDIETLNLLLSNYGIISAIQYPTLSRCIDNPTTGQNVSLNYCGAKINISCKNNYNVNNFNLALLKQNY